MPKPSVGPRSFGRARHAALQLVLGLKSTYAALPLERKGAQALSHGVTEEGMKGTKVKWPLIGVVGVAAAVFVGAGYGVMMVQIQHCRSGQACSGEGAGRICGQETHCWTTWHATSGDNSVLDRTGNIGGRPPISLPRVVPDDNSDATMDCWKNITNNTIKRSPFPQRYDGRDHDGVDIASTSANYGHGEPIRSLGAGYVSEASTSGPNGNFVRVVQGDGNEVTYIHLLDYQVEEGEKISVGQQLGRMNCTGYCGGKPGDSSYQKVSATHIHVQVRRLSDKKLLDAWDLYGGENCSASTLPTPPGGGPGGMCLLADDEVSPVSPSAKHCP